ncbi:Uncharacterized conserved protein YidB, DUF937 family [Duganella sp. CF458]|uniref:YidB family protein n=1 Tax=Duganella sp. CF458 TaxID=1884368 RepID=UPI0008E7346E|nr:YidB family protein [Duganella sp. CF458]SFG77609.1 Uncharacterized conserved protein YidB, DUF937 family [Duganella sp. CF458]
MGILDQLVGQVTGALGAQKQDAVPQGALLGGLLQMIEANGGLPAILEKMQSGGLADQVASWIGTGENQPVSGDQIANALGQDQVQAIAAQAGLAPEHASTGLAQLLPQIVDHLTPDGNVPQNALLEQGIKLLQNRFFN